MLKTIKDLLTEGELETQAAQNVRCENHKKMIYAQYPELKEIDNTLLDIASARFQAVIDKDEKLLKRLDIADKDCFEKREKFLRVNKIDPQFDVPQPICPRCDDTGFYTDERNIRMVCPCKKRELEMCYRYSGMEDYPTYSFDNYNPGYFGKSSASVREQAKQELLSVLFNLDKGNDNSSLWIYRGVAGSGKSFLSVCLCKMAINFGLGSYYARCEELPNMGEDTIEGIKHTDFLIVDDFDAFITMSNNIGSILNSILEIRASMSLPTILVTQNERVIYVKKSDMRLSGKLKRAVEIPKKKKEQKAKEA